MDDLSFKIRAQFVERIIWIVIILILLIALVVVSVYKTEKCEPASGENPETEPLPEPEVETAPPPTTPTPRPEPTPTPPPSPSNTPSGKITFSIDRLDCQSMNAAGNMTRGKINSVGIDLENGKSESLTASLSIYIWDTKNEEDKDIARTGEKPVLIGTIQPGGTYNNFVNVRSKPTSFTDTSLEHYFKGLATNTIKFKMVGGQCQIV